MSESSTSATETTNANFAQQTSPIPAPVATPPLLPAFLITGLLLAVIVCIIVWRHILERRNSQGDDDPTWPIEGIISSGGGGPKGPKPKLWDLKVLSESEGGTWGDIMPLSATALRATPKPSRPRYLVPSDRPVTFFTRMFGGERRPPRPGQPPISVLAPTQALSGVQPPDDHDDEEPIDRLQVAVLISLPCPRRVRHTPYTPEKIRESTDTDIQPPPPENSDSKGVEEGSDAGDAASYKGKKPSFETPQSHGYESKAYDEHYDDEGPLEVAFGSVVVPFVEQEW
ncbi:hypothetical protein JB92DRAFT_3011210 [Gautieria morchelliformis]|nr:hypothetical protein JB92DRAFT_3011210 [Gautieria morchelliformis]